MYINHDATCILLTTDIPSELDEHGWSVFDYIRDRYRDGQLTVTAIDVAKRERVEISQLTLQDLDINPIEGKFENAGLIGQKYAYPLFLDLEVESLVPAYHKWFAEKWPKLKNGDVAPFDVWEKRGKKVIRYKAEYSDQAKEWLAQQIEAKENSEPDSTESGLVRTPDKQSEMDTSDCAKKWQIKRIDSWKGIPPKQMECFGDYKKHFESKREKRLGRDKFISIRKKVIQDRSVKDKDVLKWERKPGEQKSKK